MSKKIKTDIEIYQEYQKSNTLRKMYLANKAGHNDIEEYRTILFNKANKLPIQTSTVSNPKVVKNTANKGDKSTIHTVHLLDSSASMRGGKFDSAFKGVRDDIFNLQENNSVDNYHSLYYFNGGPHKAVHRCKADISNMPSKIRTDNNTPLYATIKMIADDVLNGPFLKYDVTIIKIFTDGMDYCYGVHDIGPIAARVAIAKLEAAGVTVTFVATKYDMEDIINILDLDESNTLIHDNTAKGIAKAMETTTKATKSYTKKVIAGEDVSKGFYKGFVK